MTWIQLDCGWGLPAVYIKISRRFLDKLHGVAVLQDLKEDAASCQRLEAWLAEHCRSDYEGMQLVAVHFDVYTDTFVLLVLHPQFPRTKPGAQIPEWAVLVHDTETRHPYFTLEAWSKKEPAL